MGLEGLDLRDKARTAAQIPSLEAELNLLDTRVLHQQNIPSSTSGRGGALQDPSGWLAWLVD